MKDTSRSSLPEFTDAAVPLIVAYCIMFVIAAAGNLSVIITLFRSKRHRRSRISLMICHLAVADLIVAFFMIPLEVSDYNEWNCLIAIVFCDNT